MCYGIGAAAYNGHYGYGCKRRCYGFDFYQRYYNGFYNGYYCRSYEYGCSCRPERECCYDRGFYS